MTPLYDLTTLELGFTDVAAAASTIRSYVRQTATGGTLVACLQSEIGPLNQLVLLRAFPTADALADDRQRIRRDANPFGCADRLTGLRAETFAMFPGFPAPPAGEFGPIYELRTYGVKPGRLDGLMTQWAQARAERAEHSAFLLAMYSLDGPLRITHLWGYPGLEERKRAREQAARSGTWPPPAGLTCLEPGRMHSALYLPASFSPLR